MPRDGAEQPSPRDRPMEGGIGLFSSRVPIAAETILLPRYLHVPRYHTVLACSFSLQYSALNCALEHVRSKVDMAYLPRLVAVGSDLVPMCL